MRRRNFCLQPDRFPDAQISVSFLETILVPLADERLPLQEPPGAVKLISNLLSRPCITHSRVFGGALENT